MAEKAMNDALKSPSMTPKGTRDVWICRHCKAEKIIDNPYAEPERCWNYKCRRMDWNRPKKKSGRPRKPGTSPKRKPGKTKKGRRNG